jgi:ketosteroid isomerase-like protein
MSHGFGHRTSMALLCCAMGIFQPATATDGPVVHAVETGALTKLACEAGYAYARRDLTTLASLTADDYVQTDVRGVVLTRTEWLDFVRNRKAELSIECRDVDVRLYHDVAIVTGAWTYTHKTADKNIVTHSRWTAVWTKTPNGWKRHVFQNTYVDPTACGVPGGCGSRF